VCFHWCKDRNSKCYVDEFHELKSVNAVHAVILFDLSPTFSRLRQLVCHRYVARSLCLWRYSRLLHCPTLSLSLSVCVCVLIHTQHSAIERVECSVYTNTNAFVCGFTNVRMLHNTTNQTVTTPAHISHVDF